MKLMKLSMLASTAALFVGIGTVARAQVANGTYVFNETDGNSYAQGSTVTFLNDQLTSWDLVILDTDIGGSDTGDILYDTYTPSDSTYTGTGLYEAEVYGPNEWGYNIQSVSPDSSGDPLAEIGNSGGTGYIYDNPEYNAPLDPTGTWVLESPTENGGSDAPDAFGTFQLLAGALTALGACKSLLRGPATGRR